MTGAIIDPIEAHAVAIAVEARHVNCERLLWRQGENRRCAQIVGVATWRDSSGIAHTGCPRHVDGLRHRYPELLVEELPVHGTLGLSTPWARGLFGPNDRIAVANEIPPGWTLGVSVDHHRRWVILWLNDPSGTERARWENYSLRAAIPGALELARLAQKMEAEGPVPEVLVAS